MSKYCCFRCPGKDYSEKSIVDLCPSCGLAYGFPLSQPPRRIREFTVVKAIRRGFYSATFLCKQGRLERSCILKISPLEVYKFFRKDFSEECKVHFQISQDSDHIVKISDFFDERVEFGDVTLDCHIAVLDYVPGPSLDEYLKDTSSPDARQIAQIAVDLFTIWHEFSTRMKHHNDLHANNIIVQAVPPASAKANAIDGQIRAIAIDLGSVDDASKSDSREMRFGDQHWLCQHLQRMVRILRATPKDPILFDDAEWRVAEALERVVHFLLPAANAGRVPSPEQLIRLVYAYFNRAESPWTVPLTLAQFSDAFNALQLDPWYVPDLLVDPEDTWRSRIGAPGPLLITGMRGCGKTMLLRALDFHARAAISDKETIPEVLARLRADNSVGLFLSAMSLLTIPGRSEAPSALQRLFIGYSIEAIRSARHLRTLDAALIAPGYQAIIAEAIERSIDWTFDPLDQLSDYNLERALINLSASLSSSEEEVDFRTSPADAFISLGDAIRGASELWKGARILFLLDDVSTRFLRDEMIGMIFSALLFQHPKCSFKLTTEAQTLEMALYSPGLVEMARVGRDYEVFDLGAEVYEKTKLAENRKKTFVEQILERRARYYPNHPKSTPREILGDRSLEDIARMIATTTETSRTRKGVYSGISALSAVCVGDIGDVINLYELILHRASGKTYPLDPVLQSDCYQQFCSRRIYALNRRSSDLKDFALSFASASYELLVRSYRQPGGRIRQYANIYVRITTGNTTKQFERLRELIDAGVFVLHGGTPRTKTRDADPIQQFKLTFRKLFGLSNFIGLSERDRFELSGDQLEKWLNDPQKGKDILLRNQATDAEAEEATHDVWTGEANEECESIAHSEAQGELSLTFEDPVLENVFEKVSHVGLDCSAERNRIEVKRLAPEEISSLKFDTLIIGLGFEDRTLVSAQKLVSSCGAKRAFVIKYSEPGQSVEILRCVKERIADVRTIEYKDVLQTGLEIEDESACIDVTGLAKPCLFHSIRSALLNHREVTVAHTAANVYYPLNEDIAKVLEAERDRNQYDLVNSLSTILTGEEGPYSVEELIKTRIDETRRKVLCTFSSPKHQRLFTLLDAREYDSLAIALPPRGTERNEFARIAAEVVALNVKGSKCTEVATDDLRGVLDFISNEYGYWYVNRGYNFELGLTGSKMQAVAAAAASAVYKVAHCWYVRPMKFDPKRFTAGVGETRYFRLSRV